MFTYIPSLCFRTMSTIHRVGHVIVMARDLGYLIELKQREAEVAALAEILPMLIKKAVEMTTLPRFASKGKRLRQTNSRLYMDCAGEIKSCGIKIFVWLDKFAERQNRVQNYQYKYTYHIFKIAIFNNEFIFTCIDILISWL